jgi:selenocysteine lyase/cysteine desulfurase
MCLTAWLLEALTGARHGNGRPLVQVHGPTKPEGRGGTIAFNLLDVNGESLDIRRIEELANHVRISLRTGCFCNPGGGEIALGLTGTELSSCFRQPAHETHLTVDDFRMCIDGKSTGAVRVSLGIASARTDVDRFLAFAQEFVI